MTYVRFVVHRTDEDSGRRQGLFQAISELEDTDELLAHERHEWNVIYAWFVDNLDEPMRFSRSSKYHAKRVALSWFKDSASAHIGKMYALTQILQAHGILVDVIRTERPGYIVYEDRYQVVAEPFTDTPT